MKADHSVKATATSVCSSFWTLKGGNLPGFGKEGSANHQCLNSQSGSGELKKTSSGARMWFSKLEFSETGLG